MFESEANRIIGDPAELSPEVLARFAETRQTVNMRSLIPWGEHCTECVWPTCYTTCDLYEGREDGRCRRFQEGMVRIPFAGALNSYLLKISFKRWAKLSAPLRLSMHALERADKAEQRDLRAAHLIQIIPLKKLGRQASLLRYRQKKRQAARTHSVEHLPRAFVFECYNPYSNAVTLTLTIRANSSPFPYQKLLRVQPGYHRQRVPIEEIQQRVDLRGRLQLDITPNDVSDELTLYFGAMDFVVDTAPADRENRGGAGANATPGRIIKCVVWDLDNTLWNGILLEDGADKVRLKPGIVEVLKALDQRGILMSVASKNDAEEALQVLDRLKVREYFLFPRISWQPKSQAIREIAKDLNIGLDSILFIDDSAFELAEVNSVVPEVMVLDARSYMRIPDLPECDVPTTAESKKRRLLYREQAIRQRAQSEFVGEYVAFLHDCKLCLSLNVLNESNLERVHELTQRTNQMNFSGNRYSREQLIGFLDNPAYDTFVIDCSDRFGSYGTVGFCIVDLARTRMIDLMFSCRIQGKRVEHAFILYLVNKYKQNALPFSVNYRKTNKNAGPGKVFEDLLFEVVSEQDGVTRLMYPAKASIEDEHIMVIEDHTSERLNEITRI